MHKFVLFNIVNIFSILQIKSYRNERKLERLILYIILNKILKRISKVIVKMMHICIFLIDSYAKKKKREPRA